MATREQLETLLRDPEFRREFVADYVQEMVAAQIRAIRERRGWTQEQLGKVANGMSQVQVSRLENPDYSGATLNSLKRMAQAFDVGLIVRMAPFSEFMEWISTMDPERLVPPNYAEEQQLLRTLGDASLVLRADDVATLSGLVAVFTVGSTLGMLSYGELNEEQVTNWPIQAEAQVSNMRGEEKLALAA